MTHVNKQQDGEEDRSVVIRDLVWVCTVDRQSTTFIWTHWLWPPPHPPISSFTKRPLLRQESCLSDSLFGFLLPESPPPPQCVIGLQWSIAADEVLWQTDRNTRGLADIKNKAESILLLWFYLSLTCCFLSISLLFNLLFLFFFSILHTIVVLLWEMWS